MTAELQMTASVYGVDEALKILRDMDQKVYWKAVNHIKTSGSEIVELARRSFPAETVVEDAMKGWSKKGRLGYNKGRINKNIKLKFGGRKTPKGEKPLLTLVSSDAGASLFAMAGLRDGREGKPNGPDRLGRPRKPSQSKAFLDAINKSFGRAQRGPWRYAAKMRDVAADQVMRALEDVAKMANRKLVR